MEFIKLKKIIIYVNMLKITHQLEGKTYIKESRFSYIRPIHGSTRLIIYNSSNVTYMEGKVHRGAKVIVEVPEGCMLVFINDTFYTGVKSYAKHGGIYLSHLRLFAYIVVETFISFDESIEKVSKERKIVQSVTLQSYYYYFIHHKLVDVF